MRKKQQQKGIHGTVGSMGFSFRSTSFSVLFLFPVFFFAVVSCSAPDSALKVVDVENPALDVILTRFAGAVTDQGSKEFSSCERVQVAGISRLKLGSYASAYRVILAPSVLIPEKLHGKIRICFHQNDSLGLCQCEKDEWKSLYNGLWSSVMSPYEDRYVDLKLVGEVSGSLSITVEEESQQWRLLFLILGCVLLLVAPIVSNWVPFYYSSSMAIGILLVIIILLFQAMKLLPTGRKNVLYLTFYGSVLGAGTFLLHQFSMFVNSILRSFGLSEEMHNPVSVFVLVGIVIAGAALGYWLVGKFVVSEDGGVDSGVAQFVKWAMRIVAATFIFQSTLDFPLALAALISCLTICFSITSIKWWELFGISGVQTHAFVKGNRAEFLCRTRKMGSSTNLWRSPKWQHSWSDPLKKVFSPPIAKEVKNKKDYFSTFHKTPNRKKFSKKEWENFTQESTKQAMSELASSPEFTEWVINNADRIQLLPDDSSDATIGSGSDSTDENVVCSDNGFRLFKWQRDSSRLW